MSLNPSSTTSSTGVNNQFGSQKGSSGYLGLGLDLSNNSLKILDEIQHLYEERMRTLDTEAAGDADRLRVLTLQSWVKDLGEQNGLLVRTVEELEREMTQRVLLLEEKFHVTSHETHKFMTRAEHLNNKLQEGRSGSRDFASYADDSNHTVQDYGQQSSLFLETEVSHLKNDRENLCKLIQRGLETGNWSTKRFQFYEINDDDIFGPTVNYSNSSAQHIMADNLKDSKIEAKDRHIAYLEARISTLQMATMPSQEIDQIFFNKDLHQTASSVGFMATRTDTRSDCRDQFTCGDESEMDDVQQMNQEVMRHNELVTSLREQQCIIDEYCRTSKELEEELARTRRDLYAAEHNLREKDDLLHNSSKRSKDEENTVQEQSHLVTVLVVASLRADLEAVLSLYKTCCGEERLNIMENALNGREKEILQLLSENRDLWEEIQMKDGDLRQLSVSIEKQRNQQKNCGCQAKEKRIRTLLAENRKMFRKNLGKDDRLRNTVGENSKLQRKIRQLREKIVKVFAEQQKAVETVAESNTRLEIQLQDAWRQIQTVDEEKQLKGKEMLQQLDAEEQYNEENKSRIDEMQRLLDSKTEEVKIWKLEMSNLQQKHEVLLRHIKHQEIEIQDLKLKQSSEFVPKNEAEEKEQLLGVLQLELESCQNENIEIQNELLRLQHANQSFITQASSLLATVKDLKHALDVSECNCSAAMTAMDAKQSDLVRAACQEAALQEEFTAREHRLLQRLDVSECDCAAAVTAMDAKQADLVRAACQEAALQEEFTAREHHLLERLGDAQADELKLSDAVQDANGEADRLTAELNDKGRALRYATAELHSVTQHANQLKSDLEMLDQANKRLLSAQQRLETLEKKAPDMEMLSSVWQKVNQKQREHICVLKDRLQDADKRNASAQQQLHFSMQNQSVLEENYRLLESRNNTLKSELSSLENEYLSLRADSDKAPNNEVQKVPSTHSSSSREAQSGDRMRYLCDVIIKKETQIRRLYNENSSLLKTIQQLFSQNTLMRKKIQFYKETSRSDTDKNQWPRLNHTDSTLADVAVVTGGESYSTNMNDPALYPEHNYNVPTSSHLLSHTVICHEYQSPTLANGHPPCSPRESQFC